MIKHKMYHFQLKDLETKLSTTWKEIQNQTEFHDVTLACDEHQINAHKVILSLCSPVFEKLLKSNHHPYPMIYLKGVKYEELVNILDFIYQGEVSIDYDTIENFFSVAQELKINGLTEDDRKKNIDVNISEPDFFVKYLGAGKSKNLYVFDSLLHEKSLHNSTDIIDDEEKEFEEECQVDLTDEHKLVEFIEYQTFVKEEVENKSTEVTYEKVKIERKLAKKEQDRLFCCNDCDYKTKYNSNLKKHVESRHNGVQYPCDTCDNSFNRKEVLQDHIKGKHLGIQYLCNKCDHATTSKGNLKKHIASQHDGVRHSCDQCDLTYAQKYHLVEHIKSKHEGFRYSCDLCDQTYIDKGNLKKHMTSQHKDENIHDLKARKTISCDKCGKQFTSEPDLKLHRDLIH